MSEDNKLYTLKEVAALWKVTVSALYLWHKEGKISFVKVGNRNRITEKELARFLKASKTNNKNTVD